MTGMVSSERESLRRLTQRVAGMTVLCVESPRCSTGTMPESEPHVYDVQMSSRNKRRTRAIPMIATEQASAICRGLLPIAELAYMHSDRLSEAGFEAHVPLQLFFESFASDEEQRRDYR